MGLEREDHLANRALAIKRESTMGLLTAIGPGRQRGSTRIVLDLQTADGVRHIDVALFGYPGWTVIPVDNVAPVISFKVTSTESVGAGPSLNEIKAFRTRRSAAE